MPKNNPHYDVIIIGAGAAGLMAAKTAGERHKKVLLIEHSQKIGEKIRISGGGRCNFTNIDIDSSNFISQNPHFVKSALSSYSQHDFISLIESHGITYYEKTLGQLFCTGSSKDIINLFLHDCRENNVDIKTLCSVTKVEKTDLFTVDSNLGTFTSTSLIIATGGLSIPKIGASDFGYKIAKHFGLKLIPTQSALVPLVVSSSEKELFTSLSGVSIDAISSYKKQSFSESILFTHQGLSGPGILQISSYLDSFKSEILHLNLLPHLRELHKILTTHSKSTAASLLKDHLPKRLIEALSLPNFHTRLCDLNHTQITSLINLLQHYPVTISGSAGYQKAEVTKGGVNTDYLSSKTMECKHIKNLYFIGEVLDVTGWLGGYNFQWAWSSGYAAGRYCE